MEPLVASLLLGDHWMKHKLKQTVFVQYDHITTRWLRWINFCASVMCIWLYDASTNPTKWTSKFHKASEGRTALVKVGGLVGAIIVLERFDTEQVDEH